MTNFCTFAFRAFRFVTCLTNITAAFRYRAFLAFPTIKHEKQQKQHAVFLMSSVRLVTRSRQGSRQTWLFAHDRQGRIAAERESYLIASTPHDRPDGNDRLECPPGPTLSATSFLLGLVHQETQTTSRPFTHLSRPRRQPVLYQRSRRFRQRSEGDR